MTDTWTAEQADADPGGFHEHMLTLRGHSLVAQGLALNPELAAKVAAMKDWKRAWALRKWLQVYLNYIENGTDDSGNDPDPGDGEELPTPPLLEDRDARGPPEARRRAGGGAASEAARMVGADRTAVIPPRSTADKYTPYWSALVVADPVFDDDPTDDELLTDWEIDFLASVECQDYELTDRQQAKYDEIMDSLDARRSAVRSGMLARTR